LVDNHITPLFREYPELERFYLKTEKTLALPNGSSIVFGYAENPAHDLQGDIYNYQGSEWATIAVDEAGQFNEEELCFIKTCCRWPGIKAKMILTMNPGGRGHNFLKRIFIDKRYDQHEIPEDYAFIRAYGWDNVEWVKDWLSAQGIPIGDYYDKMTDDERRDCFLQHSDYGRVLAALKGKMRAAYLLGDWDAFAGQYFDVWSEEEAVQEWPKLEAWWPKWISIDWGYEHNAAVYWHTQADNHTHTYRELVGQHIAPYELGDRICQMSQGEKISDVYLSPDAFEMSRRGWISNDTIAIQLNSRLRAGGVPEAIRADNERIGGWRLMHQLLSAGLWTMDPSCKRLIECLPNLQRDEDNREDILKVDCDDTGMGGDDPADSARYGLKSRLTTPRPPVSVRVTQRIDTYAKTRGLDGIEDVDPTALAMLARRAQRLENPRKAWRKFRPGRAYQGVPAGRM
jgi:hypothetical protein